MGDTTRNTRIITSFDDPIFKKINEDLDRAFDLLEPVIPHNPAISKDDEWNDPMYDFDNYTRQTGGTNET